MPESQENIAGAIISCFNMQPLPIEGGVFVRTYLSAETYPGSSLPSRYHTVDHAFGTAILMLFTEEADSFSALHRLKTDEVYHFYLGDPIELSLLYPDGAVRTIKMGQAVLKDESVQFTVPAGVWQGSRLCAGGKYALFGTTMAPGYHDSDFEAAERETLLLQYPHEKERIHALTRPNTAGNSDFEK